MSTAIVIPSPFHFHSIIFRLILLSELNVRISENRKGKLTDDNEKFSNLITIHVPVWPRMSARRPNDCNWLTERTVLVQYYSSSWTIDYEPYRVSDCVYRACVPILCVFFLTFHHVPQSTRVGYRVWQNFRQKTHICFFPLKTRTLLLLILGQSVSGARYCTLSPVPLELVELRIMCTDTAENKNKKTRQTA